MIGGFGFLWSLSYAINSAGDTRRFWLSQKSEQYTVNPNSNVGLLHRLFAKDNNPQVVYQNNQQVFFMVGILIVIVLFLLSGVWLYRRLSLENKYQLVQINSLKKPVVIIGTLYLAWLLGMNGFFSQQPFELIYHHQKIVLLWIILRNIVVIGIIGWVFVERPWQKKDTFKWFKK